MKNGEKEYRKIAFIALTLLVLVVSGCFMNMDCQMVGDEVVTYGMANSTSAGWMLSTGRVRAYFETKIMDESLGKTVENLVDFGVDILKNKRGAGYFSFERPEESGWYDKSEVEGWFALAESERFQFGDIYLNAMGDDANSFLYYMLVHLAGSLFPVLSATKWSAYLVNVAALAMAFFFLYKVSGYFWEDYRKRLIVCALFGLSVGGLDISTYLRAYMLTIAMQLGLLWLHLRLYGAMRSGDKRQVRNSIAGLLILYPLGYVSHYTTGLWAGVLGIVTILYICRELPKESMKSNLKKYIGVGALAIGIGVLFDPMSVLGLVSKLSDAGKPLGQAMVESFTAFVNQVFGGWIFFAVFAAVFVVNAGYRIAAKRRGEQAAGDGKRRVLEWSIVGYCLLVVCLTKFAYFKVAYPLTFLVIIMELEYFGDKILKKEYAKWLYLATSTVFVVNSLLFTFRTKQNEAIWYDRVQEVLGVEDTEKMILVRPHAEGYDCFPLLTQYEEVFVLTTPETEYRILAEDKKLKETESVTVLITNVKADGEAWTEWLCGNEEAMGKMEVLYEAENRMILRLTKTV